MCRRHRANLCWMTVTQVMHCPEKHPVSSRHLAKLFRQGEWSGRWRLAETGLEGDGYVWRHVRLSWKRLGRCGIGSSSKVPQLNNFELVGRSIPPPFPHREDHLSLIMKSSHMNKIFPESSCFQLWTRMTCLLWRWIKSHSIPRRLIIEGGASQRQPTETLTHGVMS